MNSLSRTIGTAVITFLMAPSAYSDGIANSPEPIPDPNWRDQLAKEAEQLNVTHIEQFENGVYGHYKESRVFFTTVDQIPDDQKLYWVMVKVLSEKFACFMVRRRTMGDLYRFYCKDKRSVVMRKGQVGKTVHFYGRTYDRSEKLIPLKSNLPVLLPQ